MLPLEYEVLLPLITEIDPPDPDVPTPPTTAIRPPVELPRPPLSDTAPPVELPWPPLRDTTPPVDASVVWPATTCTAEPTPEFELPTDTTIPPDTPFVLVPVPIVITPLEPLDARPVLNVM